MCTFLSTNSTCLLLVRKSTDMLEILDDSLIVLGEQNLALAITETAPMKQSVKCANRSVDTIADCQELFLFTCSQLFTADSGWIFWKTLIDISHLKVWIKIYFAADAHNWRQQKQSKSAMMEADRRVASKAIDEFVSLIDQMFHLRAGIVE